MYIAYVDESGHCGRKFNSNQPIELLAGVITDITKLFKTQKEQMYLLELIRKIGIDISELKAQEIYGGRNGWGKVESDVRNQIFDEILKWMHERSCKTIICPVCSEKYFQLKESGNVIANRLQFPYEAGALNIILAIQRYKSGTKNNKGKTAIIFDEQLDHDKNITAIFESDLSFTDGYTGYTPKPRAKIQPERLDEIIDVPFFSKSHLVILMQLADIVAFIANKDIQLNYLGIEEKYDGEKDRISHWASFIKQSLIPHTAINPTGKTELEQFYRDIRPEGWTAKKWTAA